MKLPPRMARSPIQHVKKVRPDMSPYYLTLFPKLPCLGCGIFGHEGAAYRIDPDHLMHPDHGPNSRGMGRKSADKWCVPMCRGFDCPNCHDKAQTYKNGYEAWFAERWIDARGCAEALWALRDEREPIIPMTRVVLNIRSRATLNGLRTNA